MKPQQSKSAEEATSKLKSIKLCLEAHPDNEPNSEFEDRIDDLDWLIQFTLQNTAKEKEFCEALEGIRAKVFNYRQNDNSVDYTKPNCIDFALNHIDELIQKYKG